MFLTVSALTSVVQVVKHQTRPALGFQEIKEQRSRFASSKLDNGSTHSAAISLLAQAVPEGSLLEWIEGDLLFGSRSLSKRPEHSTLLVHSDMPYLLRRLQYLEACASNRVQFNFHGTSRRLQVFLSLAVVGVDIGGFFSLVSQRSTGLCHKAATIRAWMLECQP